MFYVLAECECIQLARRDGIFAVADEASGWSLDNEDVHFFTSFDDAFRCWSEWIRIRTLGYLSLD